MPSCAETQPLIRIDPSVQHRPGLSGPAIAVLSTMSRIRNRKPTGGPQYQNYLVNSFGNYHCDMDDCCGAFPHHGDQGFYERTTLTARTARK